MEYKIIILDKGDGYHPWLEQCGMFVTREAFAVRHLRNKMCRRGAERKRRHLDANAARLAAEKEFQSYDQIIDKVDTFKYFVRILSFDNIDCPAIVMNLQRAERKYGVVILPVGTGGG